MMSPLRLLSAAPELPPSACRDVGKRSRTTCAYHALVHAEARALEGTIRAPGRGPAGRGAMAAGGAAPPEALPAPRRGPFRTHGDAAPVRPDHRHRRALRVRRRRVPPDDPAPGAR